MAVSVRAVTSADGVSALTIPAATQAGDLIIVMASAPSGPVIPVMTGFSKIIDVVSTGASSSQNVHAYLETKVAVAGDAGTVFAYGSWGPASNYSMALVVVLAGNPAFNATAGITTSDGPVYVAPNVGTLDPVNPTKHFALFSQIYAAPASYSMGAPPSGYTALVTNQGATSSSGQAKGMAIVKTADEPANTTSTATVSSSIGDGVSITVQVTDIVVTSNGAAALTSGTAYLTVPNTIAGGTALLQSGTPALFGGVRKVLTTLWTSVTEPIAQWVRSV